MGQDISTPEKSSKNNAFIFRTEIHDTLNSKKEFYYRIIGNKVLRENIIYYKDGNIIKNYDLLNVELHELDDFIDLWKKSNVSFITSYSHPTLSLIFNSNSKLWKNVNHNITI